MFYRGTSPENGFQQTRTTWHTEHLLFFYAGARRLFCTSGPGLWRLILPPLPWDVISKMRENYLGLTRHNRFEPVCVCRAALCVWERPASEDRETEGESEKEIEREDDTKVDNILTSLLGCPMCLGDPNLRAYYRFNGERKCARKVNENILTYAELIYLRQLIIALGIPDIQIF